MEKRNHGCGRYARSGFHTFLVILWTFDGHSMDWAFYGQAVGSPLGHFWATFVPLLGHGAGWDGMCMFFSEPQRRPNRLGPTSGAQHLLTLANSLRPFRNALASFSAARRTSGSSHSSVLLASVCRSLSPPEQQSWSQRRRHNSTGQSRRRASLVFQIQVLVVSQSVSNHLYPTATVIAMDPRPYQDSAMLGLLSLTLAT